MFKALLCCSALLISASLWAQSNAGKSAATKAAGNWDKLVDDFFEQSYFKFNPTEGTAAGFHQYDTQLEDYSRSAIDAEVASLKTYRRRLEDVNPATLTPGQQGDREMALGYINSRLLSREEIRGWEKNPDNYSGSVTNSIFGIMSRNFAPQEERLRSVIAREKQIPRVFAAARANLKNPPEIYTQIALLQLPGLVSFFQKDVPAAFTEVHDAKLLAEFKKSNEAVIKGLESYQNFLKSDVLPRSHGDFRIGAENYRKKLLYDQMVDTPLDKLLEVGMADLRKNQQAYKETAALLDPQRTPEQVLEDLGKEHPEPSKLLQSFRDLLGGLKSFIEQKGIISIPSEVLPIVEETPPFGRALSFASMDTPGAYEKKAKEAYFNVTLPEPGWTPEEVAGHMAGFTYPVMVAIAVHEVYPGHYVQFLWTPQAPSKVRKLLGASSNAEGWAHYCEQMMLDEGYGRDAKLELAQDKEFLKLRLGQLQDALLRDARFIVGISMHTGKMTFDQGIDFFMKEGYQSHSIAQRETRRGTSDPTYLVYTLGKLQILKLREDYRRRQGASFSLHEFHDDFMRQGFPPIQIIRRALLGDAGGPAL